MKKKDSLVVPVKYRRTFWMFAKWSDGFIVFDNRSNMLSFVDAQMKLVAQSKISEVLYQTVGAHFIVMIQGKRIYLNFEKNPSHPLLNSKSDMLPVALGGALFGVKGAGIVAGASEAVSFANYDILRHRSKAYGVLIDILVSNEAKESSKPGKPGVRATYLIALAVVVPLFLPTALVNFAMAIALAFVVAIVIFFFEVGS